MKKAKQKIHVVQFPPGEIEPLFVKASNIGKVIVGLSPKTLANHRSLGIGPEYHSISGSIYYSWEELKQYFGQNRVETLGPVVRGLEG